MVCNYSDDDFSLKTVPMEEVYFQPVKYRQLPPINSCTKLFRKKLWREVRYPVGKVNEDRFTRFTTHLIFFQTERITYLTAPLYYYFVREDSIMHRQWTPKRLDDLEAAKEQIVFFDEKGLLKIKDYFIRDYIRLLCNFYYRSVSYPDIHEELGKELKSALRGYRKDLSLWEKLRAHIAMLPQMGPLLIFRQNVIQRGLPFALKALREKKLT